MSNGDRNPVATAYGLLTTNLVVLTGLGTYTGGRKVAGVLQMACGILGFVLTIAGFGPLIPRVFAGDEITFGNGFLKVAVAGMVVFGVGWVSSLISGLGLIAEARRRQRDSL